MGDGGDCSFCRVIASQGVCLPSFLSPPAATLPLLGVWPSPIYSLVFKVLIKQSCSGPGGKSALVNLLALLTQAVRKIYSTINDLLSV